MHPPRDSFKLRLYRRLLLPAVKCGILKSLVEAAFSRTGPIASPEHALRAPVFLGGFACSIWLQFSLFKAESTSTAVKSSWFEYCRSTELHGWPAYFEFGRR